MNEIGNNKIPLLGRESEQKHILIEMQTLRLSNQSHFISRQDEVAEIGTHKLEQILDAKNQWKQLLKSWKKEVKKPNVSDESYFSFDYSKLLELFDINLILKEAQSNTTKYDQDKDMREKRLKVQIDKLNELGGVYGLQNFLKTCIKQGLDDTNVVDLKQREQYFGKNEKPQIAIKSVMQNIFEQFQKERLFQVLVIVTVINFLISFEDNQNMYLIYFCLLILLVIYKAYIKQQYSKEVVQHQNDMKNRNKHLVKKCNVIRNGDNLKEINNNELVVGDLLIFKQGDFIQCDGIITKIYSGNNSIIVSQPFPNLFNSNEEKNAEEVRDTGLDETMTQSAAALIDNFVFAGSQIISGSGSLLVCTVGEKASDYIQYKQAFIEESKSEKQRAYLKQNSMYNPFAFKIESLMNKLAIQCLTSLLILLIILLIRSRSLANIANIFLYLSQLAMITIPSQLLSLINLFMIHVIKKCRSRQIYIQDYLALYWLGQVNEIIVDQIDFSVSAFSKSQINIRYFTSLQLEEAKEITLRTHLLDEANIERWAEGSQLSNGFNEKNKFTFLSRRLACPTLDHLKLDKIQSSRTLEWLEQQQSKFSFQGIVDQQKLYDDFKTKNVIIGGNEERKEQLVNLLKLYDKIIFMMGQENDRKALEMAHVSIGPHESRACIKLFPAGEINGQQYYNYILSIYECVSQGRAIYFYILSYSYALTCTSQTLMIFAIASAIFADNFYIMPVPTFIIFYLTLNHFSHQVQRQCNRDVQSYVMQRGPYVKQGRIIDKSTMNKLNKLHSILIIELTIAWYYGYFEEVQHVYIGLLFTKHVFILVKPIKQVLQQIEGIIYGLIINLINQFLLENQSYAKIQLLLRDYSIGLIIVAFNLFIGYK